MLVAICFNFLFNFISLVLVYSLVKLFFVLRLSYTLLMHVVIKKEYALSIWPKLKFYLSLSLSIMLRLPFMDSHNNSSGLKYT